MVFARLLFVLGSCVAALGACSSVEYTALPMSAHVVDAETGQPLTGVHVVADWQLEGGLEGGSRLGALMMMETQTDADGRFAFAGWGPAGPLSVGIERGSAGLKNSTPQLFLFKAGYEFHSTRNPPSVEWASSVVRSFWDGRRIELRPFRGDLVRYERQLADVSNRLRYEASTTPHGCAAGRACRTACQWERIPATIRAIRRQYEQFEAAGIRSTSIYDEFVRNDAAFQSSGCASPASLLKGDTR